MQNNESKTPYEYALENRKNKIASILKINNTCFGKNLQKLEQKDIHYRLYFIFLVFAVYKILIEIFIQNNLLEKFENYFYIYLIYYILIFLFDVLGFAIFIIFKFCLKNNSYLTKEHINLKIFIEVKNLIIKGRI